MARALQIKTSDTTSTNRMGGGGLCRSATVLDAHCTTGTSWLSIRSTKALARSWLSTTLGSGCGCQMYWILSDRLDAPSLPMPMQPQGSERIRTCQLQPGRGRCSLRTVSSFEHANRSLDETEHNDRRSSTLPAADSTLSHPEPLKPYPTTL